MTSCYGFVVLLLVQKLHFIFMMYCTTVYVTQHYKKMREKIIRKGEKIGGKIKKNGVRTYFLFQVDLHVLLLHCRINTSQLH